MAEDGLAIEIVGGRTYHWDQMPPAVRQGFERLTAQGDALMNAGARAGAIEKWKEADRLIAPYEKKKGPLPTAPVPHPPELIPDTAEALAVFTSPDVVKVGDKPVPFAVHGKGSDDQNYSPDVRSNGKVIKRHNSRMTTTYGAEPGHAGVKSGTEGKAVEPVSSSPIVRANGIPVQRHSDTCTLNNGNCPGEYVHVKSTEINKAPDGNDEGDKRGQAEKGWDGFYNNSSEAQAINAGIERAGEYVKDPSLIGQDIKSAYEALPTGAEVVEFGENVLTGAGNAVEYALNNPGEAATGIWNRGVDGLRGLWGGVTNAYDQGGVSQAGGHLAAAVLGAVNPLKKAKLAGRAAEGLEDLGDAAKTERRAKEAVERERKAEEKGDDGARSTRILDVHCFEIPDKLKGKTAEYRRQLDEQMKYINENMTADDMAYAHWVLEKAGGTGPLRQPYLQQKHRAWYKSYLREQGKTEAEIAEMTGGMAATHFLDMVAGGNPAIFSTDAAGNPVLGDTEVNSDVGNQWTQKGRAASLREEAEQMRKDGRARDKMRVVLKPC
ncbi:PAAR-like domain-containing protein [Ensifer sp. BR816]|uniref:PAAR-like domain-containing protein n=1 Tax=Rhizobium sp. (strain BR816) TaxID=1057002 RepID=UPI00037E1F4E|nr:PAAR-like domain-containing protein [Ensifer sp. BR816]